MTSALPGGQPAGHPSYGRALPPKSLLISYLLLIFLGVFGVHRFYLGKWGTGILFLLTGGVFVFGIIWDLFTLPGQLKQVNTQRAVGIA